MKNLLGLSLKAAVFIKYLLVCEANDFSKKSEEKGELISLILCENEGESVYTIMHCISNTYKSFWQGLEECLPGFVFYHR